MPSMFKDRSQAGRALARELSGHDLGQPLILALPRGGVPVAYEVAKALKAPLDTVVARKIGAPGNPEYGIGAIAPGDVVIIDKAAVWSIKAGREELDAAVAEQMQEMVRRMEKYRSGDYGAGSVTDTAIIIDDGVATGVTAFAALESARLSHPRHRLIFASPICARSTAHRLRQRVEVICLHEADELMAIGEWYENFDQVSDEDVVRYLEAASVVTMDSVRRK